jgi:hypothetical protein
MPETGPLHLVVMLVAIRRASGAARHPRDANGVRMASGSRYTTMTRA